MTGGRPWNQDPGTGSHCFQALSDTTRKCAECISGKRFSSSSPPRQPHHGTHSDGRWSLRTLQHQDSPDLRLVTSPVTRCGPIAGPTMGSMVWLSASCSLMVFHFQERPLQVESQCCWGENIQQLRISFMCANTHHRKASGGEVCRPPRGRKATVRGWEPPTLTRRHRASTWSNRRSPDSLHGDTLCARAPREAPARL